MWRQQLANLYVWLRFFHLLGLVAFLLAHGVSAGASFVLRGPVTTQTRRLLQLSQQASWGSYPGLLLLVITGVWMGFARHFWGRGWIWAAIVVLVAVMVAMGYIARPYYLARQAPAQGDEVLAEHLTRARPVAAAGIGGVGLILLVFLMVFKPF